MSKLQELFTPEVKGGGEGSGSGSYHRIVGRAKVSNDPERMRITVYERIGSGSSRLSHCSSFIARSGRCAAAAVRRACPTPRALGLVVEHGCFSRYLDGCFCRRPG